MCGALKAETEFAFRSLATGERQSHCRACHAAYRRRHYQRTKATYIENERLRLRRRRERNRLLLVAYLLEHPCVDCGETDPVALDFDHLDPSAKRMDVAKLAARKPWPAVLAEIARCEVRCASCHRRRTATQFGWRRATLTASSDGAALVEAIARATPVAADVGPTAQRPDAELRVCQVCHVPQPITEFALKDRATGLRATKCRACQRAYAKEHYVANRATYLAKARRRRVTGRDRFAALIVDYFRDHPCVDCGATDPRILEFDHRDGAHKLATVNALIRKLDWTGLIAEVAKCDVRCASCHRRRTARQFGWVRLALGGGSPAA